MGGMKEKGGIFFFFHQTGMGNSNNNNNNIEKMGVDLAAHGKGPLDASKTFESVS